MNKEIKPKMQDLVSRSFVNYRAEEKEEGSLIIGTPIVFDQPTDIGGMWEETIERGAVSQDILKDVAFFYNHDLNTKPICRTRNGKLKLTVTDKGVDMEALKAKRDKQLFEIFNVTKKFMADPV